MHVCDPSPDEKFAFVAEVFLKAQLINSHNTHGSRHQYHPHLQMKRWERAQREGSTGRLRDFWYSEFSIDLGIWSSRWNPNHIKNKGKLAKEKPGFGNFACFIQPYLICSQLQVSWWCFQKKIAPLTVYSSWSNLSWVPQSQSFKTGAESVFEGLCNIHLHISWKIVWRDE